MPIFKHRDNNLRFYVDGLELDVQDPNFFMDEEEYIQTKETIEEMLEAHENIPVDKQR